MSFSTDDGTVQVIAAGIGALNRELQKLVVGNELTPQDVLDIGLPHGIESTVSRAQRVL